LEYKVFVASFLVAVGKAVKRLLGSLKIREPASMSGDSALILANNSLKCAARLSRM
jgi:hypothetical protein